MHSILLPSRHSLTDRIIREIHERYHHADIQTTLYNIRRRHWLTKFINIDIDFCDPLLRKSNIATEYESRSLYTCLLKQYILMSLAI